MTNENLIRGTQSLGFEQVKRRKVSQCLEELRKEISPKFDKPSPSCTELGEFIKFTRINDYEKDCHIINIEREITLMCTMVYRSLSRIHQVLTLAILCMSLAAEQHLGYGTPSCNFYFPTTAVTIPLFLGIT